jgi:hypothetical protein
MLDTAVFASPDLSYPCIRLRLPVNDTIRDKSSSGPVGGTALANSPWPRFSTVQALEELAVLSQMSDVFLQRRQPILQACDLPVSRARRGFHRRE